MNILKFFCMAAVCVFVLCNQTQAQGNNNELTGAQNTLNSEYRQDFYGKKHQELEKSFENDSYPNNPEKIIGHFGLLIDRVLGVDFSKSKRDIVLSIQAEMLSKKEVIAEEHLSGNISFEEYIKQASRVIEESLEQMSNELTDEEFSALFQLKKTEVKGSFYRLINRGLPKEDQVTDPR